MSGFYVAPYERKDRRELLDLLFYARRVHTHLDWYRAGQWLDHKDSVVHVAWSPGTPSDVLIGFMGMGQPLNGASWLRLAALQDFARPEVVLGALWEALRDDLAARGVNVFAALVLNRWLDPEMPKLGFNYLEDVVTLQRNGHNLPTPPVHNVRIRRGYLEHLPDMLQIDHAAFAPPWQLSHDELRQSQRQAESCTLARVDGHYVGYQVSTRSDSSAHLARLAVVPGYQGQRIGAALLHHMIDSFNERGVNSITVNTQHSNRHSQRLYQRYGFRRNGFDLPIWLYDLRQDNTPNPPINQTGRQAP
jgi:[ribosomal protein S18]-alanine N-acetyltransferase